jgi:hypothetical protein
MSQGVFPFETDNEQQLRGSQTGRQDNPGQTVAYVDQNGNPLAFTGNPTGPYVVDIVRASSDGVTGLVQVENGQDQRPASDLFGRLWLAGLAPSGSPLVATVSRYTSAALENQRTVASGVIRPLRFNMLVPVGVALDLYLMVFDQVAAVVNGAVPIWRMLLPNMGVGGGEASETFDSSTFAIANALQLAVSTTPVTLTLSANPLALFDVLYAVP